jgi:DNA-binding SARP family transcriptional activator
VRTPLVWGRRVFCASPGLGGTMVRQRYIMGEWSDTEGGGRSTGAARDTLSEAVKELRGLTEDQLVQAVERLSDVEDISGAANISLESVRRIRLWSAGYLHLAAELEAAARCCRLIEQELRRQVDVPLAGGNGQADPVGDLRSDEPTGKGHRGKGLPGWLKAISPRNHPAHGPPDRSEAASPMALERLSMVPSAQSLQMPSRAEADVAALMLGPLEMDVAGRRVLRWSSLKARAVFQYLLIHRGRPVRRDVLMELQWPDHTYTSARNNLNVALHSLRSTLDGPWQGLQPVLYQDGCYVLNPGLTWWVDRDEFLSALSQADMDSTSGQPRQAIYHYRRAIELYRGPLFEDDLAGDWYLPEQRHLAELYLQALESLGQIYFDRAQFASAECCGQLALASDPCCEPVHRLLMRCYAAQNKQQLVTRQYRLCIDALRDELDVSPGAETLRLFRDLTSASP